MAPAEAEDIVVVEVVAEVAINQSQKLPGDFVEVQNGRVVFFMEKCQLVGIAGILNHLEIFSEPIIL